MLASLFITLAASTLATAHVILTYPGWRGNNLITNDTFPYGMQWMYPCGGMPMTENRTYWPTRGGAIAMQPGWFQGHDKATLYINLGLHDVELPDGSPNNMSLTMVPAFGILGPTKGPYPGTICLPQVPIPPGVNPKAGDKATIQVVELAQHGAALFSCVDITFVEPGDARLPRVNKTNCFNSTDIGFADIYTITTKEVGASADQPLPSRAAALALASWAAPLAAAVAWLGLL